MIEEDEYDAVFDDKRAKFIHHRPNTLIINNLEYDHADIYPDMASLCRQFHHLVRMVPSVEHVICPKIGMSNQCWNKVVGVM